MRGRTVQVGWWTLAMALAGTGQGKGGFGWNRGSTYAEGAPAPVKLVDDDMWIGGTAFAGDFYDDDLEEGESGGLRAMADRQPPMPKWCGAPLSHGHSPRAQSPPAVQGG